MIIHTAWTKKDIISYSKDNQNKRDHRTMVPKTEFHKNCTITNTINTMITKILAMNNLETTDQAAVITNKTGQDQDLTTTKSIIPDLKGTILGNHQVETTGNPIEMKMMEGGGRIHRGQSRGGRWN